MIELSSVLSDLRREFGIAPGGEVPSPLVAEAITQRLAQQRRSGPRTGDADGPEAEEG